MKSNIQYILLLQSVMFTMVACQKAEYIPLSPLTSEKNMQSINSVTGASQCVVTHTEDNVWGYTLDIFYNAYGNPDSMSFYGNFPVKMFYDSKQRLIRTNFGVDGVRFEYIYKNGSDLPASINFYYPYFIGEAPGYPISTYRLAYNSQGQIVKILTNNLISPQFGSTQTFDYNAMGNVTKVTKTSLSNTFSYVSNEGNAYDDKPNFMGGNKWLKFILYNSGVDIYYYFRMFSKNNAVQWTTDFGDGFIFRFFANYQYNNFGFANAAAIQLVFEGFTENYYESSLSTCDAAALKSTSQLSLSSSESSQRLSSKNSSKLPVTIPRH